MRIDVLSREYPPEVYGGAGVHVAELVRALRAVDGVDARVHCFGARARTRPGTTGYADPAGLADANAAIRTLGVDLEMVGGCAGTDLVHSHTWYANMAGHLAKLLHGVPHVVTAHSLEPMRPWKAEQLGGGYAVSSWAERTAYEGADAIIAVSAAMRDDILRSYPDIDPARVHVVHNGIDTEDWSAGRRTPTACASSVSTPTGPSVIFVGRITRQKGLPLFLRAAAQLPPDVQLVLCAGAPDTQEIEAEVRGLVDGLAAERDGVVWIAEMLPAPTWSRCSPPRRCSPAPRSTSRWASSTSRRWPARRPSSRRRPAASPRSSSTARPAGWSRSSRPRTAPAPRSTPSATSPTSPRPSSTRSATPSGRASAASPDGVGPRSRSAGRRSPSRRWDLPLTGRGLASSSTRRNVPVAPLPHARGPVVLDLEHPLRHRSDGAARPSAYDGPGGRAGRTVRARP